MHCFAICAVSVAVGAAVGYGFRGFISHKISAAGSAAKQSVNSAASAVEKKL